MESLVILGMVVAFLITVIAIHHSDAETARQAIRALAGLLKR